MLYNLARLHSTDENFDEMYELIKASYITHHVILSPLRRPQTKIGSHS